MIDFSRDSICRNKHFLHNLQMLLHIGGDIGGECRIFNPSLFIQVPRVNCLFFLLKFLYSMMDLCYHQALVTIHPLHHFFDGIKAFPGTGEHCNEERYQRHAKLGRGRRRSSTSGPPPPFQLIRGGGALK